MNGQLLHRMQPHMTYKPEISTYMDHYRKPVSAPVRKTLISPKFINTLRSLPPKQVQKNSYGTVYSEPTIFKGSISQFVDEQHKMTGNSFPPYQARVDVPYKQPQPNVSQREYLKKIGRLGIGITDNQARDIALKDRSPDFDNQHKVAAAGLPIPVQSAPVRSMCDQKVKRDDHWLVWRSGTPEPPGLQRRLHQPWPTPPSTAKKAFISSHSNVYEAPTYPTGPVPDSFGSMGSHPTLLGGSEEVFEPEPPAAPSQDLDAKYAPTFRQLVSDSKRDSTACPKEIKHIREKAIHIPEHRYFSVSDDIGACRDKSDKTYEHPIKFEKRILKNTMKALSSCTAAAVKENHLYNECKLQIRPLRLYKQPTTCIDKLSYKNDYEIKKCFFTCTKCPHKGDFIIDPLWSSEKLYSKNGFYAVPPKKSTETDGFRYGTFTPLKTDPKRDSWLFQEQPKRLTQFRIKPPCSY